MLTKKITWKYSVGVQPLEVSEADLSELDTLKNRISKKLSFDEDIDMKDSVHNGDSSDLLEG